MTDKPPKKPERRALTPLQKRGVYANYDCRCAVCGVYLRGVRNVFCFDHTHALCLGGGNEDENFRPLCRDCTMAKNRHDARALDKAERMEAQRLAAPSALARLKPEPATSAGLQFRKGWARRAIAPSRIVSNRFSRRNDRQGTL